MLNNKFSISVTVLHPIVLKSCLLLALLCLYSCDDTSTTSDPDRIDMLTLDMSSSDIADQDMSLINDMGPDSQDQELSLPDYDSSPDMMMVVEPDMELCGGENQPCSDEPRVTISITTPLDQAQLSRQTPGLLQAVLSVENIDPRVIAVYLDSSLQGPLLTSYNPETLEVISDLNQLTRGTHTLTLSAFAHPDFEWSTEVTVHVPCTIEADFSSPLDPANWYVMGDAYRAEGGWLEMTDQPPSSVGGIFLVGQPIQANALDVSFKIAVEAELNLNVPINQLYTNL